jgi:PhzF family phenazine biosynthesis protein
MRYQFYTADVFCDRIFGGNPLAVFPQAQGLSGEQMQKVAREFNLSETVFVLPPETAQGTRRLRIFTPTSLPDILPSALLTSSLLLEKLRQKTQLTLSLKKAWARFPLK